MIPNLHLAELIARERIREARARAAQHHLVKSLGPAARPFRVSFGLALIRMGHWLADRRASEPARARVAA